MKSQKEIMEILERDYETKVITAQSVKNVGLYPNLYRGSVKVALGKFYTDKEYDKFRDNVLKLDLP